MDAIWKKLAAWKAPDEVKFALVNHVSHLITFWGPSLFFMLVRRFAWFQRYKIQPDASPRASLYSEALAHVAKNIVSIPVVSVAFYRLLAAGGRSGKKKEGRGAATEGSSTDDEQGWAALRFGGQLPSWWTMLWQVAVAYLGYDMMFYWSHRYLHRKENLLGGYKAIHSKHHRFFATVGFAANYEHILEGIAQLFNWYLPLAFAGWLNKGRGGMHISTVFAYSCFRWVETVDAHCGYDLPWSPFSFIPLFGGALMHDYHHSSIFGNYGATIIWDRLMGTEISTYRKLRLAGKLRPGA